MKHTLKPLLFCIFIIISMQLKAQIDVTANVLPPTVCPGDTVNLSATSTWGVIANSDFNNGTFGQGWYSTQANPVFTNPCGPGPSGAHVWVGTTPSNKRTLVTVDYDVSVGNCFVNWHMRYGAQKSSGACEDPDEPDEGVRLQWSTNNGSTWTNFPGPDIEPVGSNDTNTFVGNTTTPGSGGIWEPPADGTHSGNYPPSQTIYYWHEYESDVPSIASTNSTRFRWAQLSTSNHGYDAWGIDEVEIKCPAAGNLNVSWDHGPTKLDPPAITLPSQGTTSYDTCFVVTVFDTVNSATDTACVTVFPNPVASIDHHWIDSDEIVYTDVSTPGASSYNMTGRQWLFGSAASPQTSQDSSVLVTYLSPGTYEAKLIVQNNHSCSDTSTFKANVTSNGVPETETGIEIYPNPSPGIVNIEIPDSIEHNPGISVYDFRGKLIRKWQAADKKITKLNLSKVNSGNYMIVIENENFIVTRKIMIE